MSFNSLTAEFFKDSDLEKLMQNMFAHMKTQVGNSRISDKCFTIDLSMNSHINFHNLALTRGSSSIELL